jgi:hypothetical protein
LPVRFVIQNFLYRLAHVRRLTAECPSAP